MCQSSCWENSSIFFIMEHNCDVLQCIFYCVSISCRQPPLLSSTMSISFNVLKLCLCIGIIIRTKIYNSLVLNKINWNAHLKCKICCLRLSSKKSDTGCMAGNCCQCININAVLEMLRQLLADRKHFVLCNEISSSKFHPSGQWDKGRKMKQDKLFSTRALFSTHIRCLLQDDALGLCTLGSIYE